MGSWNADSAASKYLKRLKSCVKRKMIFSRCSALLILIGTLHLAKGKEYVGGLVGLKERIQEASKPDAPCSLFVGMVGSALDTNDINIPDASTWSTSSAGCLWSRSLRTWTMRSAWLT